MNAQSISKTILPYLQLLDSLKISERTHSHTETRIFKIGN